MGRAEALAIKIPPWRSFLDGACNAAGYGLVLCAIATIRELLGSGKILGYTVFQTVQDGGWYVPNGLMVLAPSGFFLIGLIIWAMRLKLDKGAA